MMSLANAYGNYFMTQAQELAAGGPDPNFLGELAPTLAVQQQQQQDELSHLQQQAAQAQGGMMPQGDYYGAHAHNIYPTRRERSDDVVLSQRDFGVLCFMAGAATALLIHRLTKDNIKQVA
jgi:hypothetical protein